MKHIVAPLVTLFLATALTASPGKLIRHEQGVTNQYIVVLPDHTPVAAVDGLARSLAQSYGLELQEVWQYSLQGFLVVGPEANIVALSDDPRVKYVEQNAIGTMPAELSATQWTWYNGEYLWNLDRLDELSWASRDGTHNMCTEGRSGYAYVIDTGIYAHSEFETPSRVVEAYNFAGAPNGEVDTTNGCGTGYNNTYHGTAVASVLGGTRIGAAKPSLISLRIMGCDGTVNTRDMIEALDWIAGPSNTHRTSPGVMNHSGFVPVWDTNFQAYGDAVVRTVNNTNIPFFTSADNYATDACRFSPNDRAYTRTNHTGRAFVVGGTSAGADPNDYRWQEWINGSTPKIGAGGGSNGGACVSIYAPACSVYVALKTGPNDYFRLSGTSFASPLAAAVAIRWMVTQQAQTGHIPAATEVYDFLINQSQTVVYNTATAPSYWMCVRPNTAGGWDERTYTATPGVCPTGFLGPYMFPFATNTSDARMLYWDEGICW